MPIIQTCSVLRPRQFLVARAAFSLINHMYPRSAEPLLTRQYLTNRHHKYPEVVATHELMARPARLDNNARMTYTKAIEHEAACWHHWDVLTREWRE